MKSWVQLTNLNHTFSDSLVSYDRIKYVQVSRTYLGSGRNWHIFLMYSNQRLVFVQVSHIPEENGEGMQVLHYVNGQKYEPHHDYFHDTVNPQKSNGGQRVATMLMYLTTVAEGGETVFPNSAERVVGNQWSDCAKRGLAVKTQKGDALLFFR